MMMRRRHLLLRGRAADEQPQPTSKTRPDRAARVAMQENRARDAALAVEQYEAERRAVLVNTERLRALRLAKEAQSAAAKTADKPAKKD